MSELTLQAFGDASLIEQASDMRMLAQMMREDMAKDAERIRKADAWWESVLTRRDTKE